jgi:serine/threonine-protein kinase RsbW
VNIEKGATVFEEIKAGQIHDFLRLESSSKAEGMAHAQLARPTSEDSRSLSFVGIRHTLPSRAEIISPFVTQVMRFISRYRAAVESNFEIELALREALARAIVRGNREDPRKHVYVKCRCIANGEVSITVEDEGHCFDSEEVVDPACPYSRRQSHDREIQLIRTLMDEVDLEDGGSVVHMRKRATSSANTSWKQR